MGSMLRKIRKGMEMNTPQKPIEIPEAGYPMLTRMISNCLFPTDDPTNPTKKDEPVVWVASQKHPLVPNMQIIRMFVGRGGVEVYSISEKGEGMRNLIPIGNIRLIEEVMPPDIFVEELIVSEEGGDGDDDDDDDAPDAPEEPEEQPQANGQPTA